MRICAMRRNTKNNIDKMMYWDNNVDTLIKQFIKDIKQGGKAYVTAGNDKTGRNYFQRGSNSGNQRRPGIGKDYEHWYLWF